MTSLLITLENRNWIIYVGGHKDFTDLPTVSWAVLSTVSYHSLEYEVISFLLKIEEKKAGFHSQNLWKYLGKSESKTAERWVSALVGVSAILGNFPLTLVFKNNLFHKNDSVRPKAKTKIAFARSRNKHRGSAKNRCHITASQSFAQRLNSVFERMYM